jgi:hypothetical protein
MGIQLCRGGEELRAKGLSLGSPGLWAVSVAPNRTARVIGAALRWVFEGEDLPESEDVSHVKRFLLSRIHDADNDEKVASMRIVLEDLFYKYSLLRNDWKTLYDPGMVYPCPRRQWGAPTFEERLDRASVSATGQP